MIALTQSGEPLDFIAIALSIPGVKIFVKLIALFPIAIAHQLNVQISGAIDISFSVSLIDSGERSYYVTLKSDNE